MMFKVGAGLGSLAMVAGLAPFALNAQAAPPVTPTAGTPASIGDDIPDAIETKRRELREVAIKAVIAGRAKVETRNGSKVVNLGKTPAAAGQPAVDQYVELQREKTDRIFVVLAE